MHTIYITSDDNRRLRRLLLLTPYAPERRRELEFLRTELDRASIVTDAMERPTAIRIGSWFRFIDTQSGETGDHTLCLPDELGWTENGLSVTSAFGAAVIGCCAGDEVYWSTPMGRRTILIRAVKQSRRSCESHATTGRLEGVG